MSGAMTLEQVSQLSVDERLTVIADIWDTIVADGVPIPVSGELGAELDRRRAHHLANPDEARDWSEIRDEA